MYKDRLKAKKEVEKLKVHNKRAILEYLINEKRPDLRHTPLKTVKRPEELAFSDYALKATAHLGLWTSEELKEDERIAKMEIQWWRVVAFYTLRLLFGPLLETVLLLDRGLYLLEQGRDSLCLCWLGRKKFAYHPFSPKKLFLSPSISLVLNYQISYQPKQLTGNQPKDERSTNQQALSIFFSFFCMCIVKLETKSKGPKPKSKLKLRLGFGIFKNYVKARHYQLQVSLEIL